MNQARKGSRVRLGLVILLVVVVLGVAAGIYAQVSAFSYGDLQVALRARGAKVVELGTASNLTFQGAGHGLVVNGTDMAAYEYGTAIAARIDAARVSPDGSAFRGGFGPFGGTGVVVDWLAPPHHFLRGRVIVTYVGDDSAILQLLTAVLGRQFAGG